MWKQAGRSVLVLGLLLCVPGVSGDAHAKEKKESKAKKDDSVKTATKILKPSVTLELADAATSAQEIGGVRVELSRIPIETRPMVNVRVLPRESQWESWTGLRVGTAAPVWITAVPYYEVSPEDLQFKVRITNHLGKVLRLQGVALQFTMDGNSLPTDYAQNELNKVIILPEKSWEGTLRGPSMESFGLKKHVGGQDQPAEPGFTKEGVLLVGLYDVVTEVDQASNPVKRTNFEWIFAYTAAMLAEDGEAIAWKARLMPEQAQQIAGNYPAEKFVPPKPE